jgi:hypothetical protein
VADGSQGSNETFSVDTDKLKPAIAKLNNLAAQLKSAGKEFDDGCQSYGQPWGDDSAGKKFYGQYEGPHSGLITAAYTSSATLGDTAGQMSDMVTAFEQVDDQAGAEGQRLRMSIENPQSNQNPSTGGTS